MTIKYKDLELFMTELKKYGYIEQIPLKHLEFFIAKKFGTSKYIKENIKSLLVDFEFIRIAGSGIFTISTPWEPDFYKRGAKESAKDK